MQKTITLSLLFALALGAGAQTVNPKYNKTLADSLGADDYGMKMYVLTILKTGTNKNIDKARLDAAFQGHIKNIGRLAQIGKLVVAGPIEKNDKEYRGIFILNARTVEEASILLSTDPAVREKYLDAEFFPWYGSAALPMYLKWHDRVKKTEF